MAVLTNQNGTTSVDTLTYNKAGTYHALAGNDTIKITGGSGIVVYADSGSNIINVAGGSGHTVKIAASDADSDKQNGADKLTINGANLVSGYLGAGKDEITLSNTEGKNASGALSQLHGGAWGDTFTIGDGASGYQLYGDAGDDIFTINSGSNIVCWGGAANDTFNVYGGTGIKLRGGDSADVYNVIVDGVDMQLGYGNDVVNVMSGNSQKIKANLGINTINLKTGSGHVITSDIDQAASKKKGFTDEQIKAGQGIGYGVDKVNISGSAKQVTANLGDGKDEVTVSAGSGHKIYTEGWGDILNISGSTNNSTFDTGAGDDLIKVSGGSKNIIVAGEGNDNITVSGGNISELRTTGGKNTVTVSGSGDINNLYFGNQYEDMKVTGGSIGNIYNYNNAQLKFVQEGGEVFFLAGGSKYDNISIKGGTVHTIKAGGGDDDIWFTGGTVGAIYGGIGDDTIYVTAGQDSGTIIYGDEGDDIIVVNTSQEVTVHHSIYGGSGEDDITVSGHGHFVRAGADNDTVTLGNGAKGITVYLDEGDNRALSKENTEISAVVVFGDKGKDSIELKGYVENSYIYGHEGNDTILVGNTLKTSKNNQLYGDEGNDNISCINNQYALVAGGVGNDTITCTEVTYGVVYGDSAKKTESCGADTIYLSNVSRSFINGANCTNNDDSNDKNTITISGNCSKDIIFGGYGSNTLWVNGALTNSLLLSGKNEDEISITKEGCKYNKIFGGGGTDTYRISAGSNNTITGGASIDTFYISGGSNNKFIGGKTGDSYYVTTYGQNYNMIDDINSYNDINVNYNSKVLIEANDGVVNIYGAKLKDFDIQYDKDHGIAKFNDIYINSYSVYYNPIINFYDGTMSNPGTLTGTFAANKIYLSNNGIDKYGKLTDLKITWDLLAIEMGENDKAVAVADLESELNKIYEGVGTNMSAVYSYAKSSK